MRHNLRSYSSYKLVLKFDVFQEYAWRNNTPIFYCFLPYYFMKFSNYTF